MGAPGENAATVRRVHDQFNRTGRPLAEAFASDAEWTTAREDPDADTYRGLPEIERLFDTWTAMFPDLRIESDEYIESGEKVFSWVHLRGGGSSGGVRVEMEQAQVWTFRGGKAVGVDEYFDRKEGLRAAGARE